MARDSILTPERAGAVLQKNLDSNWLSHTGTVEFHNGIPHVAWCEQFEDTIAAQLKTRGPYLAAWTGAGWVDVAEPPLPDFDGSNRVEDWPYADSAVTNPVVERKRPLLASDGVSLYCAILGAVMRRVQVNPGSVTPVYLYYKQWFLYGFRLDGATWTTIGDEIFGLFPQVATIGPYDQLEDPIATAISASPDNPGACYFAFSDHGFEAHTRTLYNNLVVTSTDLDETFLAAGMMVDALVTDAHLLSRYALSLDGAGDTLTLYYQPIDGTPDEFYPNIVNAWGLAGDAGAITDTDLELGYSATIGAPAAFTIDGARYLAFPVVNPDTSRQDIALKKVEPRSPVALEHIDARSTSFDTGTVIDFTERVGMFTVSVFVEPRNIWLAGATSGGAPDGPTNLFQLDKRCSTLVGWIGGYQIGGHTEAISISAGEPNTQGILYQDAFWYFQQDFAQVGSWPDGRLAQVFRTPICRGCVPCPAAGMHVWQRI